MDFLKEFLHQKVPKAGKEIPVYYRKALRLCECLMLVYFVACFFLFWLVHGVLDWFPLIMAGATVFGLYEVGRTGIRANLAIYTVISVVWPVWNVAMFGWGGGAQQLMTVLLVLIFFNIYVPPWRKVLWLALLLGCRTGLFIWSQHHDSIAIMDETTTTIFQVSNTITAFLMLAGICAIISTSIQGTERQLRLRNQALYKEAETDALTGLPNRRAMIERIEQFRQENPQTTFSVAIADLDFFKKVNDTYGHNCGDYTLVKLTELFVAHSGGEYTVCRWGGEEFCLFMPGKNLDEAGILMNDLCFAVEKMRLSFEGIDFQITITIGVEEFDFSSPLEDLLKSADEKLYMGKDRGRNQVVI